MPYPNEHACRLENPNKYDKFNRVNCDQKHDGKCIDVIYGIKDNKSEIQALRYKKDVWSEGDAKSHCKSRGGSFEPARKDQSAGLDLILDQPWLIQKDALENLTQVFFPLFNEETEASHLRYIKDVAVLDIVGPIFRYSNIFTAFGFAVSIEQLSADFSEALAKNDIVLNIDSPGGQVDGVNDFAETIYKAREDHNIKSIVGGAAASAAYWIASAADTIAVSETSITGSIGTALLVRKRTDTDELEFVSSQSPRKRPDPETDEGKKDIMRLLDDITEIFIKKVARNRNTTSEKVKSDFGQGGVFVGAKAIDNGMVDEIGLNLVGGSNMAITAEYVREKHPDIVNELTKDKDDKLANLEQENEQLKNQKEELESQNKELEGQNEELRNKFENNSEKNNLPPEIAEKLSNLEKDNLTLKLTSVVGEEMAAKLSNFAVANVPYENVFSLAKDIKGLQKAVDDLGKAKGSSEAGDVSDTEMQSKAEELAKEKGISVVDAYTELAKKEV